MHSIKDVNYDEGYIILEIGNLNESVVSGELERTLRVYCKNGVSSFILNFKEVCDINSFSIGSLVQCYKLVNEFAGELIFYHVDEIVLNALKVTALDNMIQIFPSEEDAILSLSEAKSRL